MQVHIRARRDIPWAVGGLGALAAGVGIAHRLASRARPKDTRNRWIMVTVNCSPQRLSSRADLPDPLTRLGDAVDITICPAPGDRGTELGARLRDPARNGDAHRTVRAALREARSLIETGEVLRPDWPRPVRPLPSRRPPALAGRRP
jgi:hypothetical protein